MKTLAEYLAEYIDVAVGFDGVLPDNPTVLQGWIEQGIATYQAIENCRVSVFGGKCPDCDVIMDYKESVLFTAIDGTDIECGTYECPKCGYIVYG